MLLVDNIKVNLLVIKINGETIIWSVTYEFFYVDILIFKRVKIIYKLLFFMFITRLNIKTSSKTWGKNSNYIFILNFNYRSIYFYTKDDN